MSSRSVVALGVLTLLALISALLFVGGRSDGELAETPLLVPGLKAIINDVEAIDLEAAGNTQIAALRRDESRWVVQNRDDYEADFREVHDLLRNLAEATRAEPKTAQSAWYPRLGLSDISSDSALGIRVAFPGTDLPAVILGNQDEITGGRYARLDGEPQSWLTDRALEIPRDLDGWLERSVMDIPADELAEVTIVHPDGDRVRLRPTDGEDNQWVLLDVPEGREAAPRWQLRPVANGLANVSLEDVRRNESVPEDAVRALYVTRDGLNFVVDLFVENGQGWASFSVSAEAEPVMVGEEPAARDHAELLADAAAVDARLSPWQFALSDAKFETMTRRLDDLLAAPATDPSL